MSKELPKDGSSEKKIKITASCFMGLSHLVYLHDYVKGLFFALCEILFIALLPNTVRKLFDLITLGTPHPDLPIKQRDNSVFMLIDGILMLAFVAIFVIVYIISVKSATKEYKDYCRKGYLGNQKEHLNTALGKSFPLFGLAPSFIIVVIFVIVPLLFSVCVAFTNYSDPAHIPPANTVDWVGFQNFYELMGGNATWSKGFARVAGWTLVWAILSTFTCYFGGLIVAVQLKEINVKVVDGLSTRKQEMYDLSDAFIILPGGMGTLDELTDIMTKQQVGESCKPIYMLNTAKYWEIFGQIIDHMQTERFMPSADDYNLHVVNTPDELIKKLLDANDFIA